MLIKKIFFSFLILLGISLSYLLLFSQYENLIIENLGTKINSDCNELNPVISSDGKTLYFCRDDCSDGSSSQNIWYSTLGEDNSWSEAQLMGAPLNNDGNNFIVSVTPGDNSVLLGNVYNSDSTMERGVSISYLTKDGWSFPERLIINDYYNLNQYGGFYLCSDGKTLLMAVERDNSYGDKDLYVSFLNGDNTWSSPMNLGSTLNTDKVEISPFLASDGKTLYFSSSGHSGYGDADIFMSRRLDDKWTSWTEPKNLGPSINTSEWDAFFKTDAAGSYAFCVSSQKSFGKSDIFRFKIPDKSKPLPVMLIIGKVSCYKRLIPLEAQIQYEILPEGKESGIARSNGKDGKYNMALPAGNFYGYFADAENYIGINQILDLKKLKEYSEINRDIELIPAEDSLICIRNIFFGFARSGLTKESLLERHRLITFLKENMGTVCEVTGYTDDIGSVKANVKLSKKRAESAVQFLRKSGIDNRRIVIKGYGKMGYVISNDTEYGRSLNRRVEFKVFESEY